MTTRRLPSPALLRSLTADRDLLHLYVDAQDPAAFAALARRYGPLARRTAADACPAAADDVAQATLELLGRKAKAVAARESAAGWVFETARRLALKARTAAARRARHEARAGAPAPPPDPLDTLTFREVRAAVAEEVARLPDEVRVPLVLCYWAGESQPAAASRLGCSLSTLKRRLDVGRERLAVRLARRGFAGPALLAVLTALQASAGVPPLGGVRLDRLKAELQPRHPAALSPRATSAFLAVATTLVAVGALALAPAGDPPPPAADPKPPEAAKVPGPAVDAFGDPLPPGALARLGSVRFRTADFPKLLSVSPDGKRLVSATGHLDSRFALWEADTGRLIREVAPAGIPVPEAIGWLPDGRGLAAYKVTFKDYVLWDFTDPDARPPVGDDFRSSGPGSLSACAFSPDGALLAGGERAGPQGMAGTLRVWPVRPGRPVREAEPRFTVEKPDGFLALAFTPDGKRLVGITRAREPNKMVRGAIIGADPGEAAETDRVFVWDVATSKEWIAFDVPAAGWGGGFSSIMTPHAVSPDGKTLFTAPRGGHVHAYDLATGKRRFDAVAFGPLEGTAKASMPQWKGQATELAVTPDGKTVIAAEMPGRTVGLDAATGEVRWRGGRDMDSIYGIAVFPDSRRFVLGHGARQVGIYDVATGKPLVEPPGHRGGMSTVRIAADGKSAMTAGWDNVLFRWDLLTGRELGRVAGADKLRVASIAPDGRRGFGNQGLVDAATGKVLAPVDLPHLGWFGVERAGRVAWLPDGSVVAADEESRAVRYGPDGKKLAEYVVAKPGKPRTGPPVVGVAAAPDGKTVVLVGEPASPPAPEGAIRLRPDTGWVAVFDADSGKKVREWEAKGEGRFTAAAFLPDGSRVVLTRHVSHMPQVGGTQATGVELAAGVVLFDPATGEHVCPFDAPDPTGRYRWMGAVAASPTGAQVATVEGDKTLTVYETATGGIRRRLRGHRGCPGGVHPGRVAAGDRQRRRHRPRLGHDPAAAGGAGRAVGRGSSQAVGNVV
jgi:RNA polymerase sigma factor (sigma-70 family)